MINKPTKGEKTFDICNILILGIVGVICLYPLLYVVFASFSSSSALMETTGLLFRPLEPTTAAYKAVFENKFVLSGFKNTLFILVIGTSLNMVLTLMGAYVLSRKRVMLNSFLMIMFMIPMYFGGGLIPTYLVVKSLGLDNSLWALILPGAVSTYNMIIMRTGYASVPETLHEAAILDGAGEFEIFVKIYTPLVKATAAVIFLYYAVAHWNSWFSAAIYLNDRDKYPLQLVLREVLISKDTNSMAAAGSSGYASSDTEGVAKSIQYATIVVSTVPILVIYPFIQKYFVKGVMIGSVKG